MNLFFGKNFLPALLGIFLLLFVSQKASATCPTCTGDIKRYRSTANINVNINNNSWDPNGSPNTNQIARFNDGRNYTWIANNQSIKGIILEGNSNLILDRGNQGNSPSFEIGGTSPTDKGCIIIRNGSTLTLRYITNLKNVNICVEEGGKLIIDSRSEDRNDYTFDGVDIDLQGPGAEIEFGEADIILDGGLTISGYTGQGCTLNADGSYTLPDPIPNISADPDMTNIPQFCEFLNAAGFGILPVEFMYFNSSYNIEKRKASLSWATAKEVNNSHFEIERSINNVNEWNTIGSIKGAGWSDMPLEYIYEDKSIPLSGGIAYYRIKQIDFDGKNSYSETISERIQNVQSTGNSWRIFPNPTQGEIKIGLTNLEKYNGQEISARIVNSGIKSQFFFSRDLENLSREISNVLRQSKKGLYVLEIKWGKNVEHIKIVKN